MKRHYLFLTRTDQLYGAERRLMEIFQYINYDEYLISWAVKDKKVFYPMIKSKKLPINLIQLPLLKNEGMIKSFFKMYRFLKRISPHYVVYSQFYFKSFTLPELIAGFLVSKGNVYMIVHDEAPLYKYKSKLHFGCIPGLGLGWRKERLFRRLMVYFTKSTLAVSKEVREILLKLYKYPSSKVKLFYHGRDLKKFCPDPATRHHMRQKFKISDKEIIIISTSRLDKTKSIDRLINAFDMLFQKYRNIWLFILGDGPLKNELSNLADQKTSRERIKFLGFHNDVSPFLKMSDIFVLPSEKEGFGNAVIEAMATGLIVIATKVAGPNEIIKNGINGFLVERSEEDMLRGLTKVLLLTERERKEISINARRFVMDNFDLRKRVKEELKSLGIEINE